MRHIIQVLTATAICPTYDYDPPPVGYFGGNGMQLTTHPWKPQRLNRRGLSDVCHEKDKMFLVTNLKICIKYHILLHD